MQMLPERRFLLPLFAVFVVLSTRCGPTLAQRSYAERRARANASASAWAASLPRCGELPATEATFRAEGTIAPSSSGSMTLLYCEPPACCNRFRPEYIALTTATREEHRLLFRRVPGVPTLFVSDVLECEWGPWMRVFAQTRVVVLGTSSPGGVIVSAVCKAE